MDRTKIIYLSFSLGLANCATPNTLENKNAYFSASTSRSYDAVNGCIALGLSNFTAHHFIPTSTPDETRYADSGGISTFMVVDVRKNGVVEIRNGYQGAVGIKSRVKALVQSCI